MSASPVPAGRASGSCWELTATVSERLAGQNAKGQGEPSEGRVTLIQIFRAIHKSARPAFLWQPAKPEVWNSAISSRG